MLRSLDTVVLLLAGPTITLESFIHTNSTSPFNLLLGSLTVLLPHMHDRCSRGPIQLITVETLELFLDLRSHPSVLPCPIRSTLTLCVLITDVVHLSHSVDHLRVR